jgi:hypothetical protein
VAAGHLLRQKSSIPRGLSFFSLHLTHWHYEITQHYSRDKALGLPESGTPEQVINTRACIMNDAGPFFMTVLKNAFYSAPCILYLAGLLQKSC